MELPATREGSCHRYNLLLTRRNKRGEKSCLSRPSSEISLQRKVLRALRGHEETMLTHPGISKDEFPTNKQTWAMKMEIMKTSIQAKHHGGTRMKTRTTTDGPTFSKSHHKLCLRTQPWRRRKSPMSAVLGSTGKRGSRDRPRETLRFLDNPRRALTAEIAGD